MKVLVNKYQKTLGCTICESCKSVLSIQKTDVSYEFNGDKTVSVFYCGACGHKQEFQRKYLTTRKKAMD
jgi:RNase P subunit RPR2